MSNRIVGTFKKNKKNDNYNFAYQGISKVDGSKTNKRIFIDSKDIPENIKQLEKESKYGAKLSYDFEKETINELNEEEQNILKEKRKEWAQEKNEETYKKADLAFAKLNEEGHIANRILKKAITPKEEGEKKEIKISGNLVEIKGNEETPKTILAINIPVTSQNGNKFPEETMDVLKTTLKELNLNTKEEEYKNKYYLRIFINLANNQGLKDIKEQLEVTNGKQKFASFQMPLSKFMYIQNGKRYFKKEYYVPKKEEQAQEQKQEEKEENNNKRRNVSNINF